MLVKMLNREGIIIILYILPSLLHSSFMLQITTLVSCDLDR